MHAFNRLNVTIAMLILNGTIMVSIPSEGLGQSADELAKKAEGELRRTKSDLMTGKYQAVYDKLGTIDGMIAGIQAANPAHPSLAKLIPAFKEQKAAVEQKLGKSLPVKSSLEVAASASATTPAPKAPAAAAAAVAAPAAAAPAAVAQSSSGKAAALPYDARRPMDEFSHHYASYESARKELATAKGDDYRLLVKRIGGRVDDMALSLDEARKAAAAKGVTAHPAFDDAATKLTAAREVSAQAQGEQNKKAAAAAEKEKAAGSAGASMKSLLEELRASTFNKANGAVIYYNDPSEVQDLLTAIESFEKNRQAEVQKTLANFEAQYGKTEAEIEKNTGDWQTANAYQEIKKGIVNVGKTREVMAEDLVKKYEAGFSDLGGIADFSKVKRVTDLKRYISMAVRFAPANTKAKEAEANHEKRANAALKDFFAGVDKRTWPGQAANAASPAGSLAEAGMKFFREDEEWGQRDKNPRAKDKEIRKPLAVAIRGPWSVQEKNIMGQPIMYGVPALVAVELASEKELKLVRVFDVTLRTEEREGVKQAPPFLSITVGNSFYIRPGALK
jgi:hypothetical protein